MYQFANGITPRSALRARRLVPAVAILLVLAWQSFFVQTHVHPLARLPETKITSPGNTHASDTRRDPGPCPLCQALSLAGNLISPAPPTFDMPAIAGAVALPSTLTLWLRRDRSHAWLGRGPPHRSPTRQA